MDESWRMSIGSMVPRRHSTEQERRSRRDPDPDDFRDVFGGPPRTVLLRRFSGDFGENFRPGNFYDEIFRPADWVGFPARGGRNLPGFRIPAGRGRGVFVRTEEGFYDDIFGSDSGNRRSRSRSKSKSNSSQEEDLRSPTERPSIAEDAMLSSAASKLRPITIPTCRRHYAFRPITIPTCRRHDSSPHSTYSGGEESCSHRTLPHSFFMDRGSSCTDYFRQQQSHIGFSSCFSPPPETISLDPSFCRSLKKKSGGGDIISDSGSPSSVVSSSVFVNVPVGREMDKMVVEEGEAAETSFIIEIDGSHRMQGETEEAAASAAAADETIAWAKEKFWNQVSSTGLEVRDETVLPHSKVAKGGTVQLMQTEEPVCYREWRDNMQEREKQSS